MKKITLQAGSISSLDQFYDEVELKMTKDLGWNMGRNLDTFNDVCRGGFGVFEYGEKLELTINNAEKLKSTLGQNETLIWLRKKVLQCHESNIESVKSEIENMEQGKGETVYDMVLSIISEHEHITLILS